MVPLLALAQTVASELVVPPTVNGYTVTVEFTVAPEQPSATGVIVKVTVIGAAVVLVKNPVILPLPLAAIPVTDVVLSLPQLNVEADTEPLNSIAVMEDPVQIFCDEIDTIAVGVGLTSTVAVTGIPSHPFAVGVIVKVTNIGEVVVLVNTPLIEAPLPLSLIPVTPSKLSLVQLKLVPAVVLEKSIGIMAFAEQIVWLESDANITGFGSTKTVEVIGAPIQPSATGVMVNNTVCS
jgi:hypothetical protein